MARFKISINISLQLMEYSYLLDQADECEDPYLRLVYACKYIYILYIMFSLPTLLRLLFLCSASWAISVYFAYQRTWKPFNPILGETYEMANHGGISFLSEQVQLLHTFSV